MTTKKQTNKQNKLCNKHIFEPSATRPIESTLESSAALQRCHHHAIARLSWSETGPSMGLEHGCVRHADATV